jgi:hypothetical protein
VLEAVLVGEVGVDGGDVLVVGVALFLRVAKVDVLEGPHLVETEGLLDLVEGDLLGGLSGE